MSKYVRLFACLLLIGLIAAPLSAAQKEQKKKKQQKNRQNIAAQIMKQLQKVDLSDEQEAKIKEIASSHREQIVALRKKVALTPEQRKARAAATKAARAEGKKGKELVAAADAAAKLTEDQQSAQGELKQAMGTLRKEVMGVLTDEQRQALGKKRGAKKAGAKKAAGEKKTAKKKKDAA